MVVFNHEQDDFAGIKQLEAEMATLPQFRGGAGKFSSEIQGSNVMQVKPPSTSLFTLLKNASDVDEVVFGHETSGLSKEEADVANKIEHSPLYEGTAGMHSSEKSIAESAFWYGGPKGKLTTQIEQLSSSTDQSFQRPQKTDMLAFKATAEFDGAAGAPPALMTADGTYRHAERRFGIKPPDAMMEDFAAATNAGERNANGMPLPVLSQEHFKGSIKSVVFSGPEPEGNREVLGVPVLGKNATLLERREQTRREAVASGCRSQMYANQSEFSNAAGLASDELYFANSADMVRRIKPVTRKAGYSSMTDVDMVVFGHDLEGGDKDGASLVKEGSFAGAAGMSSDDIHSTLSTLKMAPKDVPQMRDQMDNIVFGREMQDSEKDVRAEAMFLEMQRGAGGQASAQIGAKGFDSRLEFYSMADNGGDMPTNLLGNKNEPASDLLGPRLRGEAREYPIAYAGAVGAPRDKLGRMESNSRYVVGSQGGGSAATADVRRPRNDLDSGDVAAVLTGEGSRASQLIADGRAVHSAAGKPSRQTNDESVPMLLEDKDTETEKKFAARNWSGTNVKATLSGEGYIVRDTIPAGYDMAKPPKGALIDNRTMVDSVAALNLLQPEENVIDGVDDDLADGGGLQGNTNWTDGKTDYELYQYMKNFGQGPPYGSDPLDSWYGRPDYTTNKERTEFGVQERLVSAYNKAANYVEPSVTEHGGRRKNFQAAEVRAEYEGAVKQQRQAHGIARQVPFGVDTRKVDYKTSSFEGLEQGLAAWGGPDKIDTTSMASRMARRRLEAQQRRSPINSPKGSTAIVAKP